jgi:hypothetical protein
MSKSEIGKGEEGIRKPMCFVIMPVSEPEGYVKGHFRHVYDDILAPACNQAGFSAIRADLVKQSNLIHLDILQKLLDAPMAVCDLSSRNPNVMFELALRQAFDKPVALVQEVGTPPVFDISPFRYSEYRKERTYHEVLEDQSNIATAVKDTFDAYKTGKGVNSIVKLLALSTHAAIPEINAPEASANIQQLILAELSQLRQEVRDSRREAFAATRVLRNRTSAELSRLDDTLREAELRILNYSTDPQEIDRAQSIFHECRALWSAVVHGSSDLPPSERERFAEYEHRLRRLELELQRAIEGSQSKRKK